MQYTRVAIIGLSCLMLACATPYPNTPEGQVAFYVNQAQVAISKGNCSSAGPEIDAAISRPTGNEKIKEFFSKDEKARDCYYELHQKQIAGVSEALRANAIFLKLTAIKEAEIFSGGQVNALFAMLEKTVTDGNVTGSVQLVLGDKTDRFPALSNAYHQKIIINRSVENLQKGSDVRPVAALMSYVTKHGVDSIEGKRIESLLPTFNIRRDEIDVVGKIFPKFSSTRKEEITARVFLQVKGDRLLAEDVRQLLREKIRGVEWVTSSGSGSVNLIIERIRSDEKNSPEQSQTITYAQHEVDTLSAVMLMPRNASYIYETVSGGSTIEYGYVVSAVIDGKTVADDLIRGKVGGEYKRCQNSRIQNVFGGTTSAGFVANDDMRQRCSGPSSISIEQLRQEIFSKVLDGVLKIPSIKRAHELN